MKRLRLVGLELLGARNDKTSIVSLEYFPTSHKIFVTEIFDRLSASEASESASAGARPVFDTLFVEPTAQKRGLAPHRKRDKNLLPSSDLDVLGALTHLQEPNAKLFVNVPLQLPPCLLCERSGCSPVNGCLAPEVKWVQRTFSRSEKKQQVEFSPYTQRPIEVWMRHAFLPEIPKELRFDIDETLGGNKAPLTARFHFLRRFLKFAKTSEVWPKLSVVQLGIEHRISRRALQSYRHLEVGAQARMEILETLADAYSIFIYDRDLRRMATSLSAFNAFISAFTGYLAECDQTQDPPKGFPVNSGWVLFPATEPSEGLIKRLDTTKSFDHGEKTRRTSRIKLRK